MKKIIITGGTGFIGLSLAQHLKDQGYEPVLIARAKPKNSCPFTFLPWDGHSLGDWKESLNGAHALVNLAGKSVDCIKTPENCDLILRSRVDSTTVLGEALRSVTNPPKIWVQMSTAHIYGDPPAQICTESSSTGYGLAPFVGKAWEDAFLRSLPDGTRGVRLRTSFVIGKNGGALGSLIKIVRQGFGGKVSHGKQGISWIHEYDMNNLILAAIENENYKDFYISSAPNPVSNQVFMKEIKKRTSMPIALPSPAWLVRFGSKYVFKTDPELVLYGRYVKSEKLDAMGFVFKFPELGGALDDLMG